MFDTLDTTKLDFYPGLCPQAPGKFVSVGKSGTLRISPELAKQWPADKHYCQVGYCADGPALLLVPSGNVRGALRWQTTTEAPKRSPRVSARGAIKYFKITPKRLHAYPGRWTDGMIQIDLSDAVVPEPVPAEATAPTEPALDGPSPGRVRCAKCGAEYKAVQRAAGWCPWGHRDITGQICPGNTMAGLPVS